MPSQRVQDFTLTFSGAAQRLSSVLTNPAVGGPDDLSIQLLTLQPDTANAAACYVGGTSAVSATLYGFALPVGSGNPAPLVLSLAQARARLSDFWVFGTSGQKLHILLVGY